MTMIDPKKFPDQQFGIGQSPTRKEDVQLLTGQGCYTDDLSLPKQAYGVILRSSIAHGVIQGYNLTKALTGPGVSAIYTGPDMAAAGYNPMLCALPLTSKDGSPLIKPPRHSLARDKVRHVGEPLALVVAETLAQARDAAELVEVEIEELPAVVEMAAALAAGAPILHEEATSNLALDGEIGDAVKTEAAFAAAAHVTKLRMVNNRVVVAAMEPRAAIADYRDGRFELYIGCQGVFGLRGGLAGLMNLESDQVRVLSRHTGGSFGMKAAPYPEYVPLLHAAKALGRPIRWRDERTESFVSDHQARDAIVEAELALDNNGRFLAVRVNSVANMGAYLSGFGPAMPIVNILKNMPGLYQTGAIHIATKCVFTNTIFIGPYRGAGRPEANYYMERLVDKAARETGRDPVELRRLNQIQPEQIPYAALSGLDYDSGDFPTVLEKGLARADWDGFAGRQQTSRAQGKIRGRGIATYLEVTGPPGKEMGGIRFEDNGRVSIITGTLDYGQGHATAFAQVLVQLLGVPFDAIDLIQGDSDELIAGGGTGGSRSIQASGKAIFDASEQVIAQGRELAAHYLETAKEDIEFAAGSFTIAGTDRHIDVMDLAIRVAGDDNLPAGLPSSLSVSMIAETPPSSFPNGCHIAEVEVDPDTGVVDVVRYSVVDDFGVLVNPELVEGQVHGGVAQGIGQALMENTVYGDDGQLLSGSFMDYAMPRAGDMPNFDLEFHVVPAASNPLGVKGCGEAGTTGALPAVMNAVVDALSELGIDHIDMPATPERVWRAIAQAPALNKGAAS